MNTALVCIAKDEDNYIDEWIEYHKLLGFNDIIIYQNDWRANLKTNTSILKILDGPNLLLNAYNSFIDTYYSKYDFAAFFDVDEFLVLKNHKTISEFLYNYNDVNAIAINWRLFGDSHIKDVNNNYAVLSRFMYCENKLSNNCKHIINLKRTKNNVKFIFNPHCINTLFVDPNRKFTIHMIGSIPLINDDNNNEIAELYHYRNKTLVECIQKRYKKQIACTNGIQLNTYIEYDKFINVFNLHNKNDMINTLAYDFYMSNKL